MTTLQQPTGSGFGITSTGADVIHGIGLAGKATVITGGYSGLGQETALVLWDLSERLPGISTNF